MYRGQIDDPTLLAPRRLPAGPGARKRPNPPVVQRSSIIRMQPDIPRGVLCLLTAGGSRVVPRSSCKRRSRRHDRSWADLRAAGVDAAAGLALLTVGFIGALSLQRRCAWLLGVQLVLLVLMLHGITVLLESQPRFAITWIHAGFVEFIDRTGTTAPALDARWSWPGFFALAAFWVGSGQLAALRPILTVTPVVNNLLYLVALGLLVSTIRMSWQARWLAALLFCLLNWVGQDYFSPQGWTFLLYLLFVGLLVTWFRPSEMAFAAAPSTLVGAHVCGGRLWGETSPGELPPRKAEPAEKVVLLAVVVGLFTAATVSHQLTPLAMVICAVGAGRRTPVHAHRAPRAARRDLHGVDQLHDPVVLDGPPRGDPEQRRRCGGDGVLERRRARVGGQRRAPVGRPRPDAHDRAGLPDGRLGTAAPEAARDRGPRAPGADRRPDRSARSCRATAARSPCASTCSRSPPRACSPRWPSSPTRQRVPRSSLDAPPAYALWFCCSPSSSPATATNSSNGSLMGRSAR